MKKLFLFFISAVLLVSLLTYVSALANPAAVYCEEMNNEFGGYDYQINTDENGNQYGVCIPSNGDEYEEWAFLKGKVGEDDSYCAKKGYGIKTINENGNEYAVCIVPKSGEIEAEQDKRTGLAGEQKNLGSLGMEVSMEELMNLGEKVAARGSLQTRQGISSESEEGKRLLSSFQEQKGFTSSIYNETNYSYWDWRNPPNTTAYSSDKFSFFDTIQGWLTSVKDQGNCGSCWSFSAHGSIDAKYEIEQNNSRLNPDLSEQNSVSCDRGCYYSNSSNCQGDCSSGGYMDLALRFFMLNGTVDESCFPYTSGTTSNAGVCSNRCSDYQSRAWTITSYNTTWPDGGIQLWLTNNQTKQLLMDYGPLSASMYLENDPGIGIYSCTNDSAEPNHGIVLVGYNDTSNISTSYWIIKNSWGEGFGESGYFKLGFNECNFTSEFEYAINVTAPEFKPSITLNSPADHNLTTNTLVSFNFSVSNRVFNYSTCDLIVDNQAVNNTDLAQNGTSTILSYNLSIGQHNWSINCWENGLGIVNSSETRTIGDTNAPVVHLISPLNNVFQNTNTTYHTFNVTDDSGPANCTMYWRGNSNNFDSAVPVNGSTQNALSVISTDGTIIWYINCTDAAGNIGMSEVWNVSIDTVYPIVNIAYPQNITYASIISSMNYTLTETNPSLCWYFNGTANNTIACGTNITTNLRSNEGSNTWIVYANDSAGNINSTSVTFLVDTIYPAIDYFSPNPVDNANFSANNFTVTVNVTDANLVNVTFELFNSTNNLVNESLGSRSLPELPYIYFSGSKMYIHPTDNSVNITWSPAYNITGAQSDINGSNNTIAIVNYYGAGNYAAKVCSDLSYGGYDDWYLPAINQTSAMFAQRDNITLGSYTSQWVNFTTNGYYWSSTETNSDSAQYVVFGEGGVGGHLKNNDYHVRCVRGQNLGFGSGIYSQTYYNLSDGKYYYNVTATDLVNNKNSTTTRGITFDTTYPTINFTFPTETSGTTNTTRNYLLVNVTSEDTNFKNITINLFNSAKTLINSTNFITNSSYLNFSSLSDGTYYFNATACDILNNCNHTETRNVTIDANSPIITINSPLNNSYYNNVIFNVSLNKNGTCLYSIDGAANLTMNSTDNKNFSAINSSMSQVVHNLTFSCNDTFGRLNSTSLRFYFDNTSPVVALISPTNNNEDYEEDHSVTFKYNVTENLGITNCSLIVGGNVVGHTDNPDITAHEESINYIFPSSGTYDWSIKCYDNVGLSDEEERTIKIKATVSSSSSGGGGSTDNDPITYTVSKTKLSEGYTKQIGIGDRLKFSLDSANHTLTLNSINGKNVTIAVASTVQTLNLGVGGEIKLDLTSDNYYDLSIKLIDIVGSTAKFTIKEIYEFRTDILNSTVNSSLDLTNSSSVDDGDNGGWSNERINNIKKTFSNIFSNKYVLIGMGILIMAIIVYFVWYFRRKIRRKKGWDK